MDILKSIEYKNWQRDNEAWRRPDFFERKPTETPAERNRRIERARRQPFNQSVIHCLMFSRFACLVFSRFAV